MHQNGHWLIINLEVLTSCMNCKAIMTNWTSFQHRRFHRCNEISWTISISISLAGQWKPGNLSPPKETSASPKNLSALTLIHYIPICSHTTIIPHFTQRFRNQLAQRSHHQERTKTFSFAKFQVPSSFLYETRCRYPMRALPRCKAANSEHQTRMLYTWNSEQPFVWWMFLWNNPFFNIMIWSHPFRKQPIKNA